ncbi:MAG: hypothetical protein R3F62_28360 [Planctomycetota bacterium]
MAFQRSEEQKKDLKLKIYAAVFLLIVGGTVAYFGPGIHRFQIEPAMKKKDPDALLRAASILWWTGRRTEAIKVYEDFYLMFRGDESHNEQLYELASTFREYQANPDAWAFYMPHLWHNRFYDAENEVYLEPDIKPVNPEGKPHPRLPEALIRVGSFWEDEKNRLYYVWMYKVIDECFPDADPEIRKLAENGLLRAASRSL